MRSQLLQNNSHDYRHAEKQFQTANAKNVLMCQIKEKEALKKEEKVRVYYDDLKMIETRNEEDKKEKELQTRQNELKLDYKKAITEQMQENTTKKQQVLLQKNRPIVFFDATGSSKVQKNNVKNNCPQKELEEYRKMKSELNEIERKESNKTNK